MTHYGERESRGKSGGKCDHKGMPIIVERVDEKVVAKCSSCGARGPQRSSSKQARQALLREEA